MTGDEFDDLMDQLRRLGGIEEGLDRVLDGRAMAADMAREHRFGRFPQPAYMDGFRTQAEQLDLTKADVLLNDVECRRDEIVQRLRDAVTGRR